MGSLGTSHTGPREWDAEVYHRVSDFQFEWGREVLQRLPLRGDEHVLDAGCGSGRVTAALLERLPRGRVIAVDASEAMVRKARETVGDRAEVRVADLSELELEEQVDAIFSNAVFHWIPDHERLFTRLRTILAPGGTLVAQCGGEGNVASLGVAIREVGRTPAFSRALAETRRIWNFASAEETADRLERAGFVDVRCWLERKRVQPDRPAAFLRTVALGPHLARLPERSRDRFVEEVLERMGEPLTLDYVRLNIDARSPQQGTGRQAPCAGVPV